MPDANRRSPKRASKDAPPRQTPRTGRRHLIAAAAVAVLAGAGVLGWSASQQSQAAVTSQAGVMTATTATQAQATQAPATSQQTQVAQTQSSQTQTSQTQSQSTQPQPLPDMVMGNPNAPITIIEYASMTCPHCADFEEHTFPELKKQYLDTGRAKLVFREFPLDRLALMAAAVARCAGPDRFFPFVEMLFHTQVDWVRSSDPIGAIKKIVRMGGLDPSMVDTCLANKKVIDGILAVRLKGDKTYHVNATPTFVINGKVYTGDMPFDQLNNILKGIEGKS